MATPPTPANPITRPVYPSLSASQNTSVFQSYNSSNASLRAPSPASSAPLPSPSAAERPHGYFGAVDVQQQQSAQQQQRAQSPQFGYQPSRQGAGSNNSETANYLSQAALLAEAAKRAQMAVVMRDLDSMEL
ncbi:hypothetical protein P280DRAFT_514910 [Massarina eburnea CBS 473.64]|uniref:Uncharacterized protein n=1 Tax=Massarina eburnea CBS 473.64 TaxID=1395130 RepID=A0A6A6S9P1_9PLEO|nr:hypothetical protein P280DRAFT_514910 [Massarina eburnea CBS 473.64]